MQTRRRFLRDGGLALAGLGLMPHSAGAAEPRPKRLVVIYQRGGADGLNMVVPHADPEYYRRRPTIAVGRPGQAGGAIDLDGFFGFHPRLAPLKTLYDRGELAVLPACGLPVATTSHLDAQSLMESTIDEVARHADWASVQFIETGNWDHHSDAGCADGLFGARLDDLARAVAAVTNDARPVPGDTVIVTVSEFGRSLVENRRRGTEHGRATATLVIGGGINGGRIYGQWPGLAQDRLCEGHGVQMTTDLRDVLAELASLGEERTLGLLRSGA